jgi:DNA-binding response OmpR family regulator
VAERVGFPAGLRVALIDHDSGDLAEAERQLRQHQYDVRSCPSLQHAISLLAAPSGFAPDVVVADISLCSDQLLRAARGLPLVVTSRCSDAGSVVRAISFGAVEVLQKPLCSLKLKNIWQHTVRKMMYTSSGAAAKEASQGSAPGSSSSGPASCSANSSLLDSGSLASSAANLRLEQELETDVQSAPQRCCSSGVAAPACPRAASSQTSSPTPSAAASAGAAPAAAAGKPGGTAMGIPHSGPFLALPHGLAWGFPRDLSKITTPLRMPGLPPLPFLAHAGLPRMLPGMLPGTLPPFPFPFLPPGALPAPPGLPAAAAAAALPSMIPTPAPSGTSPLLPLATSSSWVAGAGARGPAQGGSPGAAALPSTTTTTTTSQPPLPPRGGERCELEALLPACFPPGEDAAADELPEHPLARACAADCAGDDMWASVALPPSCAPCDEAPAAPGVGKRRASSRRARERARGGSPLSGASCGSEGDLGLCLHKSPSFADLLTETLSFC